MCNLYSFRKSPEEVKALFSYPEQPNFPPRDVVAPGQPIAIVKGEKTDRHFTLVRWGFVPSWTKEIMPGKPLTNARSESAAILTTEPNAMMAQIHTRMPVVIKPQDFTRWLDHSRPDGRHVADLLKPVEDSFFVAGATQLPGRKRQAPAPQPVPEKRPDNQMKLF